MTEPTAEFTSWFAGRRDHFQRAQDDLADAAKRFVDDWGSQFGFRRPEHDVHGLLKTPRRIFDKCVKKGFVDDFERVLTIVPAPVGDIARVRVVVRTRKDVEALRAAFEERWPMGDVTFEDTMFSPTESGYRALHMNGRTEAQVRDEKVWVPYEVQVKTVAQDAWGYYTHDSTYVPTEFNQHPRWGQVAALQRVLSDQLHTVDQLQEQIEVVAEETAYEISQGADPNDVMFANVRLALRELYDEKCTVIEAQRLVTRAREVGVQSMDEFRQRIAPDSSASAEAAESFRVLRKRDATGVELAAELLSREPEPE